MYYAIVATLMFAFPLLSIVIEATAFDVAWSAMLVVKWFAFWAVGWRLFLAGLRQAVQPAYTAREILGFKSDESLLVVRELGFANLAMGAVGVASLFMPGWRTAVALSGGIFYALAGVTHLFQGHRNRLENVAMVSDSFAAAMLLGSLALVVAGR